MTAFRSKAADKQPVFFVAIYRRDYEAYIIEHFLAMPLSIYRLFCPKNACISDNYG
jgi:hypothetical protein